MTHPPQPPSTPPHGQPQQPGYGYPQQPAQHPQWAQQAPYPGPAPWQPPPQPKKHLSGWALTGIIIASLFGGILLLGAVGAALDPDDGPAHSASESASESPRVKATAAGKADAKPVEKPATSKPAAPAKPTPKPKPKPVEYPDGDYIVGEDIPPGTYQTDGAEKGLFEFCSVTTDPTDESKFPQLKSANADERIIITLTRADGVVSISGCEPLTPRK